MNSDCEVWDRLWALLYEENYDRIAYVYRIGTVGEIIKPYLIKSFADTLLPEHLRDDHGGGSFRLLIREGRKMIFSGNIVIGQAKLASQ